MNYYFYGLLNAMSGGAAPTRGLISRTSNQIQEWFRSVDQERNKQDQDLRMEERRKERVHIARELHDTLLQGFLGACLLLNAALEEMPADSPSKPSLSRVLRLMQRVIDEGRGVLQGLRSPGIESSGLEQSFYDLGEEFNIGARFRVLVMGRPQALKPTILQQIYLIVREALVNALRHSRATSIEAEVEYLPNKLRVVVRDNGSGIDSDVLRSGRDSHWGLLGMRERANAIGARLDIRSRRGAGTEVEISVAGDKTLIFT